MFTETDVYEVLWANYEVTWEKLPEDFVLDEAPVDSINQPLLAAALTESMVMAIRLPDDALITTNYGICATVNNQIVVKAPDWGYVPSMRVARSEILRSYTPYIQGDLPAIVMEFLSDPEGNHEYSMNDDYPPGKFFFTKKF